MDWIEIYGFVRNLFWPTQLIKYSYCVLLMSLTGSILFLAWYVIGLILEKRGFVNIVFELLKVVALFFVVPISFLYLWHFSKDRSIGHGYLFDPTPTFTLLSSIFMTVWFLGSICFLIYLVYDAGRTKKRYSDAFACEVYKRRIFEETCRQLQVSSEKIALLQSYRTTTPFVYGLHKPCIVLPVRKYSQEELQVIFIHELMHYKQRDILLKYASQVILCLHFFNPLAWLFCQVIQKWSEYTCDYRSCTYMGNGKKYFDVICNMAFKEQRQNYLSSTLFECENELVDRIKRFKKNGEKKRMKKIWAIMVLTAALVSSTATVCAATNKSVDMYLKWYKATEEAIEEQPKVIVEAEEFVEYEDIEGITVKTAEFTQHARTLIGAEWSVQNNEQLCTDYISFEVGDTVMVSYMIVPEDVSLKVGLKSRAGTKRYINATGTSHHDFEMNSSGEWCVFVENLSGKTVDVTLSIMY